MTTDVENPAAAASGEVPPKRGRGRPRNTTTTAPPLEGAPKDTPPKRSHKAKAGSKVTPGQTKQALTVALVGLDTVLGIVSASTKSNFWTNEDRLEQGETAAIVSAVYRELETYPKAMAFFTSLVVGSVHAQLAAVLIAVAIPRLARRGVVPDQMVLLAYTVLATYAGDTSAFTPTEVPNAPTFDPFAAAVGTGPAPFGGGENGTGQDYVNGRAPTGSVPYSGVSQ